ncbi:hypothetical protein [Brevundimonas sp.]|uniref:hypothetical protein n=1 Tax=Brevundimonas sp. TaxID=1871086 RepID=UPI002FCB233A
MIIRLTAILMAASALTACGASEQTAEPAAAPAATTVASPAAAGDRTVFSDPAIGIAFDHAPGRRTGPCPDVEEAGCVALFEGDKHVISLQVKDGAVGAVAAAEAGFERNSDGVLMTTYGRFAPVPVEPFSGPGWTGLRARVTCGVSDGETGFHAAGGECLWAVIGDGERAVVASTQGILGLDDDTMRTLTSIRFLPRA